MGYLWGTRAGLLEFLGLKKVLAAPPFRNQKSIPEYCSSNTLEVTTRMEFEPKLKLKTRIALEPKTLIKERKKEREEERKKERKKGKKERKKERKKEKKKERKKERK